MNISHMKAYVQALEALRDQIFEDLDASKSENEIVIYGDLSIAANGIGSAMEALNNIIENNQGDDEGEEADPKYELRYCWEPNKDGSVEQTTKDNPDAFISLYKQDEFGLWDCIEDFDDREAYNGFLEEIMEKNPKMYEALKDLEIS